MKRLAAFALSILLLCGVSLADSDPDVCEHEYSYRPYLINYTERYIAENYPDDSDAFYGYALCKLCSDMPLLVVDPCMLEAAPCEPDECAHRLYVLPDFSYSAWKTVEDKLGRPYDELRQYRVGVCIDCNVVVTMFEVVDNGEHQMVEKQGFHIDGQYIHVTCQECLLCGLMTGELVPCISYEDGNCERTK